MLAKVGSLIFSGRLFSVLRDYARRLRQGFLFEYHWRWGANAGSRRRWKDALRREAPVQARLIADLKARGVAMAPAAEVLGQEGAALLRDVESLAKAFASSPKVADRIARYQSDPKDSPGKDYIVKLLSDFEMLAPDHPLLRLGLSEPLLNVANGYLELFSKLKGANVWYTIPVDSERPRQNSQNWHRDPEDRRLVKAFYCLSDVGPASGPLEYIPGSRPGGPYAHLFPLAGGGGIYSYPDQARIEREVPPGARVSCECPAGTMVFCDTSGFHRGGYATKGERLLATWMYLTPATRFGRSFGLDRSRLDGGLSEAARRALE
ncbi:MAG: phytanoyl-CoA dioxygenase family protein [Elusimicrobia bacterium]|nr:phytanoyl-CoA dioxygenase family protein [Elusimicrobiota bacterium]